MFLSSHGVSTALAVKIYKQYGDGALNILKNTPYRLARDMYGIGFLTADKIARALGMKEDDPARIEAGVEYVLAKFVDEGHVFAERDALVDESREALGVRMRRSKRRLSGFKPKNQSSSKMKRFI